MQLRTGLLRDQNFRRLYASVAVGSVGLQISRIALPLVAVLSLNASEFEVGLIAALSSAALLIFGLPAGIWIDRLRRRTIIIVSDGTRAAILLTIPVAWLSDALSIWQLFFVAFSLGVCNVFFDTASQSYLPTLVGREQIVEANAKLESIRQVFSLAGPSGGGQLILLFGAPLALLISTVSLWLSTFFTWTIKRKEEIPAERSGLNLRQEVGEGLRFVLGNKLMRAMAIATCWFNLCVAAYFAMSLVFMARVLGLSAGTIGLALSIGGAGGLIGAFTARRITEALGQGPSMWIVPLVCTPFYLVLPFVSGDWTIWLAAVAGAINSFGVVVYNIAHVSSRQRMTPDRLLGRMNATMRFLNWNSIPIGSIIGGILGEVSGPLLALVYTASAACLSFLPILLSPLRKLRELPTPTEDVTVVSG